jgi:hypothetical protein
VIVGVVLVVVGIALIWSNLILGLIPGLILIALGIVALVISGVWRGGLAVLRFGSTKSCPACHSAVPTSAAYCATCGHQFQ